MGCGKSSVGRKLAGLLGWDFLDLDDVIEQSQGRKIPEIFEAEGEPAFRAMELAALKMVMDEYSSSSDGGLVLALGGGTVMTTECARLIHEHTYCIYLRASVETLLKNLEGEAAGRPMLQPTAGSSLIDYDTLRARISELMELRATTYEYISHLTIDTDDKSINEIASACTSVGE